MSAPIVFAVKNPRFVQQFPDGSDELWVADVTASRHGAFIKDFACVYFVESRGVAFVYGIEREDSMPLGLKTENMLKQQEFLQFLHRETENGTRALGVLAYAFSGREYANEAGATAAYIVARAEPLNIAIGFWDRHGNYNLVSLDAEGSADWLNSAREMVCFEDLGT